MGGSFTASAHLDARLPDMMAARSSRLRAALILALRMPPGAHSGRGRAGQTPTAHVRRNVPSPLHGPEHQHYDDDLRSQRLYDPRLCA